MDRVQPTKLQLWPEGPEADSAPLPPLPMDRALLGLHDSGDLSEQHYAAEAMLPKARNRRGGEGAEPYTLQWFLDIEHRRHTGRGHWLPRLLEFGKHSGEKLLGLGSGLGTDWVQYARHGASVVVCSAQADQLALTRRNFELRGLTGRFLQARPDDLPVESASIDVVCTNVALYDDEASQALVTELYRVLKPGGKVLAVIPAKYDVSFWSGKLFPWLRWFRSAEETRRIPFSARRLRRLFGRFVEHRVHKRQLHRSEVPLAWRGLPLSVLERLMGRVLVLKAFKPLSAAISVPLAA